MAAFRSAGVSLPHYSGAQYQTLPHVPLDSVQVGDLMFWGSGGSEHVAIYVGDGKILEAGGSTHIVHIGPIWGHPVGARARHRLEASAEPNPLAPAASRDPSGPAPQAPRADSQTSTHAARRSVVERRSGRRKPGTTAPDRGRSVVGHDAQHGLDAVHVHARGLHESLGGRFGVQRQLTGRVHHVRAVPLQCGTRPRARRATGRARRRSRTAGSPRGFPCPARPCTARGERVLGVRGPDGPGRRASSRARRAQHVADVVGLELPGTDQPAGGRPGRTAVTPLRPSPRRSTRRWNPELRLPAKTRAVRQLSSTTRRVGSTTFRCASPPAGADGVAESGTWSCTASAPEPSKRTGSPGDASTIGIDQIPALMPAFGATRDCVDRVAGLRVLRAGADRVVPG